MGNTEALIDHPRSMFLEGLPPRLEPGHKATLRVRPLVT